MARRLCLVLMLLVSGLVARPARADNFKLTTGRELTGEVLPSSANDAGVQVKVGEGDYERIPWASFSQEDLKKLAQNKKLVPFVEPFIEVSQEERMKKTEVPIKQPLRLERPAVHSLLGALGSSGLGLLILVLLYAANVYAAYEIAIFRAQPVALVCGVSAVLPLLGPIVFLSLPTRVKPAEATWAPGSAAGAPTAEAYNPMQAVGAEHPSALKLAEGEAAQAGPALPATTTYQRGQFTFNRRFFETKFPNFFGVIRRDADRDLVLVVKSSRGEYIGQRITRIAANDMHLQVQRGHASEEVTIPFVEVQEVRLKHKDA